MVTLLDWTLILFEWYMTTLVVKNGHPKDTCYCEIGLYVPNIVIVLDYVFFHNWQGWLACSLFWRQRIFSPDFLLLLHLNSDLQNLI